MWLNILNLGGGIWVPKVIYVFVANSGRSDDRFNAQVQSKFPFLL